MLEDISINGRLIGKGHPPYIIAEMSGNHNGDKQLALDIIRSAKKAGVDAVKLQTYKPETMTLDVDHPRFYVGSSNSWDGEHLYKLYENAHTPWEWHEDMFNLAENIGITIFSSPFDQTAVDLLESLNAPAYKIASFEIVDHALIRACALTGKPLIISTGMANLSDIDEAISVARETGNEKIIVLKCTSNYPASPSEFNLATMKNISETFDVHVGLSDHSIGLGVPVAASALGAVVIEKHITITENEGVDAEFSSTSEEFSRLVLETKAASESVGVITYSQGEDEENYKRYRRSLVIAENIKAGEELTAHNIKSLRPGGGLHPKYLEQVLGMKARVDLVKGSPVKWDLIA